MVIKIFPHLPKPSDGLPSSTLTFKSRQYLPYISFSRKIKREKKKCYLTHFEATDP